MDNYINTVKGKDEYDTIDAVVSLYRIMIVYYLLF